MIFIRFFIDFNITDKYILTFRNSHIPSYLMMIVPYNVLEHVSIHRVSHENLLTLNDQIMDFKCALLCRMANRVGSVPFF